MGRVKGSLAVRIKGFIKPGEKKRSTGAVSDPRISSKLIFFNLRVVPRMARTTGSCAVGIVVYLVQNVTVVVQNAL